MSNRCWIVGNGASLRETPLDLLQGEHTFGLNDCSRAFDFTSWRPTYYVKTEFEFAGDEQMDYVLPHLQNPNTHCFITAQSAALCESLAPARWPINATYLKTSCVHNKANAFHGTRPDKWHLPKICVFGGATHIALQLAVLMAKYEQIFLVGMDMGWQEYDRGNEPDPNHFDPAYPELGMFPLNERDATHNLFYELAHYEAAIRGIDIYNATVGGNLEVFERTTVEKVLGT